eukprot:TRINITY_DN2913_c1_g1_i4.p1 TRINITY_DN2913_c1_g1~~TRINITY_DN2913_c1_g1_i4.p1  ORF type:complete len:912 (-),score=102.65 TRINITY_DN2913_c1_g1_i4:1496-4231(-)
MRNYMNELWSLMGPAFLVSVAYLDPGNWATAIESGSQFGYTLVWVILLSSLIAILLQTLAARLGIVTGKHLAQICREAYPPVVCYMLWILCEISIVALDLTMVLGTAIGLNLLFKWSVLPCILLTGLDGLVLMIVIPKLGVRKAELITVGLVCCVLICVMTDLFISNPPLNSLASGLIPRLPHDALTAAVSLLGANVMPHNFFLHSALVSGKRFQDRINYDNRSSVKSLCHYNMVDVSVALGVALVVNLAVLALAAATFNQRGVAVSTLQQAHDMMEQLLSSSAAPKAFGLALLCTGQLSTFTGTIAGQITIKGFLNLNMSTWLRRLVTRTSAIIPAAVTYFYYGDWGCYKLLVIAQIVLALQLPFTLIPLIKATSSRKLMGPFANTFLIQLLCWGSTVLIFSANLLLLVDLLSHQPQASLQNRQFTENFVPLQQWLHDVTNLAYEDTKDFLVLCLFILSSSVFLLLLFWMLITPLQCNMGLVKGKVSLGLQQKNSDEDFWQHQGQGQGQGQGVGGQGQGIVQSDIEWQVDKISNYMDRETFGQRSKFVMLPQIWEKIKDLFYGYVYYPYPRFPIVDWDYIEKKHDQELLQSSEQSQLLQLQDQSTVEDAQEVSSQGISHQSGLGRGERKRLAVVLDEFWGNFYDRHGKHVGCSVLAHIQNRTSTCLPSMPNSNVNFSPFFPYCCIVQQPQQISLSWRKQRFTDKGIYECIVQCLSQVQDSLKLIEMQEQIGIHKQAIDMLSVNNTLDFSNLHLNVKQFLDVAWKCNFDEKFSLFSQPPRASLSSSSGGDFAQAQICRLFFSFGFVCIGCLLVLCAMEPRPDLWGRYASVLNRLQFLMLDVQGMKSMQFEIDQELMCREIFNLVKESEKSLQNKKGPKGTGAGNVAFPKGKEILGSVLKRYKKYLQSIPME